MKKHLVLLISILLSFGIEKAHAQCSPASDVCTACATFTPTVTPITVSYLCPGQIVTVPTITLSGSPYSLNPGAYTWTPSSGVSTTTGSGGGGSTTFNTTITAPSSYTATATYVLAAISLGPNLICNGSFECGGTSCFSTGAYGVGSSAGQEMISSNPSTAPTSSYCSFYDRTLGSASGHMLVVNGASSPKDFWAENVNLCCNTTYTFTVHFRPTGLNALAATPSISVYVGTTLVGGPFILGPTPTCTSDWTTYTYSIPIHTGTTLCGTQTIHMVDNTTAAIGNDFAVDDIALQRNCTTQTVVQLVPGISTPETFSPVALCVCAGTASASVHVNGTNGDQGHFTITNSLGTVTGPYNYTITGGGATLPLTGLAAGTYTITITEIEPAGCTTYAAANITTTITILPTNAGSIIGTPKICVNDNPTFSDPVPGGTWSSTYPAIASVDASGVVTGHSAGSTTITYSISNCCSTSAYIATYPVTVYSISPGTITHLVPSDLACINTTIPLNDPVLFGTWSLDAAPSGTTINSLSGIVTAGSATGTVMVRYAVVMATDPHCPNHTTYTFNLIDKPTTPVVTAVAPCPAVCIGSPAGITLNGTGGITGAIAGDVWAPLWHTPTGTPGVLTSTSYYPTYGQDVLTIPFLSGTGTLNVIYEISNICGSVSSSINIDVDPNPVVAFSDVVGSTSVDLCMGQTINPSPTPAGGVWTGGSSTVATIDGSGIITAVGVGPTTFTYTYTSPSCPNCHGLATYTVNVHPNPTVTVTSAPPATGVPLTVLSCGGPVTLTETSSVASPDVIATYTWIDPSLSIVSTATSAVVNPTVTATYTVTVATNNHCKASASITVVPAKTCVCSYESGTGAASAFSLLTTSASYTGSNFLLNSDITITGTVTWTNCIIAISSGRTIKVAPGAKLILRGCHLFCCNPDMWAGIVLSTDGINPTGQLELYNNTLIEDARIAVYINKPIARPEYTTGTGTAYLTLYSHGAIFNKNTVAIEIVNFTNHAYAWSDPAADDVFDPSYPFHIENTVFTSRNFNTFSTAPGITTTWPFVWPVASGSAPALKAPLAVSNPYSPKYFIDNGTYPAVFCNNGAPASAGIFLQGIGYTTTATPGSEVYSGFINGAMPTTGNTELNMFDHMQTGIYAINSNVLSRNSVFMHSVNSNKAANGYGIYSFSDGSGNYKLNVYGVSGSYTNAFYDCSQDVFTNNLYSIHAEKNYLYSNHQSTILTDVQGQYGFNMSGYHCYDVQVNKNNIFNIKTAISYTTTLPPAGGTELIGQVTIDNNIINGTATGTAPGSTYHEYMYRGIVVQNLATSLGSSAILLGTETNVDGNTIGNVFNGIYVQSGAMQNYVITTDNNTINLITDNTAAAPYSQTGITHAGTFNSYTYNNTVTGPGYLTPTPPLYLSPVGTLPYTNPSQKIEGIYITQVGSEMTECNTVKDINTGFHFYSTNKENWIHNTMIHNAYGFVLDDGYIAGQPDAGIDPSSTTGNIWDATTTGGGWTGWTGYNFQTYTSGASTDPSFSPMTVTIDPTQDPTNNGTDFGSPYSVLFGSIIESSTYPVAGCVAPPVTTVASRHMFENCATLHMPYFADPYVLQKHWIAQKITWDAIQADTTILDSSAIMTAFQGLTATSRYKYVTDINNALVNADFTTASAGLAYGIDTFVNTGTDTLTSVTIGDDPGADNVVQNYRQYYTLLMGYLTDTLSPADSAQLLTLAQKCPDIDGTVIYQARALYSQVFGDMQIFNDYGCDGKSGGGVLSKGKQPVGKPTTVIAQKQQYRLYPNPTDGHVSLEQAVPDNGAVNAEVWNATGVRIFKGPLHFEGGKTNMQVIDPVPGVYLLQLTDSNGGRFNLKFVIE